MRENENFRFWIKELKFNPKDALYETLRVACFWAGVRGLALRGAIVNPKSKIELPNAQ